MKITIATHNGPLEIDAEVFGEWACHPGVGDDADRWVVTHVPTGRRIRSPGDLNEEQAEKLASALGERIPRGIVPPVPADYDVTGVTPPEFKQPAKLVRSIVFDTLGRVEAP
jgi:hypothetical protein